MIGRNSPFRGIGGLKGVIIYLSIILAINKMNNETLSLDTKIGIAGGTLLTIFSNITLNDIEKTVVLGAIGTMVSIIVSMALKSLFEFLKKDV
jgi:hypothetical protein